MIVNESDEARPQHRDEQPDQDPGHRRSPLLGHGGADSWLVRQRTCRPLDNAQKLEHAAEKAAQGRQGSERNEASLHWARSGPKQRGRSQGGTSRAQKLSSARSASTRRRARLRRRPGSTRQRTGRPLDHAQKLEHTAESILARAKMRRTQEGESKAAHLSLLHHSVD